MLYVYILFFIYLFLFRSSSNLLNNNNGICLINRTEDILDDLKEYSFIENIKKISSSKPKGNLIFIFILILILILFFQT
jgi:hypothetical protein